MAFDYTQRGYKLRFCESAQSPKLNRKAREERQETLENAFNFARFAFLAVKAETLLRFPIQKAQ